MRRILEKWRQEPSSGLERFFEQPEIERMGANRDCTFMLEAKDGFFYQNESDEPFARPAMAAASMRAPTAICRTRLAIRPSFSGWGRILSPEPASGA